MGLVLENIKYKEYLNDISCEFLDGSINGIYGDNSKYIIDIINGDISENKIRICCYEYELGKLFSI